MAPDATERDFILANTSPSAPPHVPEISLRLATEAHDLWLKTEEELGAIGLPPPFWAFAWAGGQGLARYVLDNPDIVEARKVLDFATGSGIVAIAAAKAGAACVHAADIDRFAVAACRLNSYDNGVAVTMRYDDLVGSDEAFDIILAGDVFYDRDMAAAILPWLTQRAAGGTTILVGDPGRSYFPKDGLEHLKTYSVPVISDLEDSSVKRTGVYRFAAPIA